MRRRMPSRMSIDSDSNTMGIHNGMTVTADNIASTSASTASNLGAPIDIPSELDLSKKVAVERLRCALTLDRSKRAAASSSSTHQRSRRPRGITLELAGRVRTLRCAVPQPVLSLFR
jgi:hypothetical protein